MTPIFWALIGAWELILILALFAIPATIVGVALVLFCLFRARRRVGCTPPELPLDQRQ